MAAGTTRRGHEPFEPEQVVETDHDQHVYWRGIGEWTTLAGAEAPSFDRIPGDWTYVWGRAEGPIDRAYDLQTGHRTEDTSTEGAYLLKSHAPDDVDIEGTHAARGGPIPERRATLPPGEYVRADRTRSPKGVLVRLDGRGLARAIELKCTRRLGPGGREQTRTRRIDLTRYWDPRTAASNTVQSEGPGVFLPHSIQSPQE